MQLDPKEVEEVAKTLYIRALKMLPRDIKQGFERLLRSETDATGRAILGTMVRTSRSPSAPRISSARIPASRSTTSPSGAMSISMVWR